MDQAKRDLIFDLDRSMRYHRHRTGHFEFLHRLAMFTAIASSMGVLADYFSGSIGAIIVAAVAALDLTFDFRGMVKTHHGLAGRFAQLMAKAHAAKDEEALATVNEESIGTYADEPPTYRALNEYCFNEALRARDGHERNSDRLVMIPLHARLVMNLWRFSGTRFRSRAEAASPA